MTIHLKTWGDLACFTRPAMRVERVSYVVITPSASRRRACLAAPNWVNLAFN
jgi:CRISPR-associated Cas5-like protein